MNSLLMLNVYRKEVDNFDMNAIVKEFFVMTRKVKMHFSILSLHVKSDE